MVRSNNRWHFADHTRPRLWHCFGGATTIIMIETYHYPQFPQELSAAFVALFTGVTNAAELRLRLIRAASMPGEEGETEREDVNFAFIDAGKVCSWVLR